MRLGLDKPLLFSLGTAISLFEKTRGVVVGYSSTRGDPDEVRYVLRLDDGTIVHSISQWVTRDPHGSR